MNANVNANYGGNERKNNGNDKQQNYNQAAMKSVAQNRDVHNATKSVMKDKNVRNAAYNAYKSSGNDPNQNRKVVSALAQNKQMQGDHIPLNYYHYTKYINSTASNSPTNDETKPIYRIICDW